jgi:hypothetical protein
MMAAAKALDARLMPEAEASWPARSFCRRRCGVCRTMERAVIRGASRKLSIGFVDLFLVAELATRLNRLGYREASASDTTPEIAGLQENYNISAVDWAVIDASGTPRQTLKQCETRTAHSGRLRPNSAEQ